MVHSGEVAEFLLRRKFFLTALEFHQELQEHVDNEPIPEVLGNAFVRLPEIEEISDLSSFFAQCLPPVTDEEGGMEMVVPLLSQGTSEQVQNLQQQLQEKQEQIDMLEYNLRKSNDAMESLRNQMASLPSENITATKEAEQIAKDLEVAEEMKIHEKRTLNFLLKNYLVQSGYKRTAITLSDEAVDQDLESWRDVGLNCSEPPSLLSFYRYFYNAGPNQYLNKIEEEARLYKKKALKWKARGKKIPELEAQIHELKMTRKFEKAGESSGTSTEPTEAKEVPNETNTVKKEEKEVEKSINYADQKFRFEPLVLPVIRKIEWLEDNSTIAKQIKSVSVLGKNQEGPVLIMGDTLPIITRSVLLKARKDVLPMLLIGIQQHPDPKVRDSLTNLLFNLIKKPDEQQRQMIIIGCVALARLIGKERTEGELLPQCWEQISSKYEERRVLVAESCGALAAHTKSSMRVSLILSILMQLLDDKSELVREAVVKNVAQLISYFEDGTKYSKIEELLLKLFYDPSRDVINSLTQVLIPIFMEWSQMLGLLLTRFIPLFTAEMRKLLKNMDPGRINEGDVSRVEMIFDIILVVIPHIAEVLLTHSPLQPGSPASKPIVTMPTLNASQDGDEESEEGFGGEFGIQDDSVLLDTKQRDHLFTQLNDSFLENESRPKSEWMWKELSWLVDDFVPELIKTICVARALESPRIVNSMSVIVSKLCSVFGEAFTSQIIHEKFQDVLIKERNFFQSPKACMYLTSYTHMGKNLIRNICAVENARKRAAPVFMLGVLTAGNESSLLAFLKEMIQNIAEGNDGWNPTEHFSMLKDSIRLLCTSAKKTTIIVTLLTRDLVVSPSAEVRALVVRLYEDIMLFLSASDLESKLLPALLTLSSDASLSVQLATVKQLCNVAKIVTQKNLIERLDVQFDELLSTSGHDILMEVLREFIQLIPSVNAIFRTSCILPKLIKIVDLNNQTSNEKQKTEGAKLVIEAYRSFNGCVTTKEMIESYILPGLRLLHANSKDMHPAQIAIAGRMISDMERAIGKTKKLP